MKKNPIHSVEFLGYEPHRALVRVNGYVYEFSPIWQFQIEDVARAFSVDAKRGLKMLIRLATEIRVRKGSRSNPLTPAEVSKMYGQAVDALKATKEKKGAARLSAAERAATLSGVMKEYGGGVGRYASRRLDPQIADTWRRASAETAMNNPMFAPNLVWPPYLEMILMEGVRPERLASDYAAINEVMKRLPKKKPVSMVKARAVLMEQGWPKDVADELLQAAKALETRARKSKRRRNGKKNRTKRNITLFEMDLRMWEKGYRYRLTPKSRKFEPLYAKTIRDVAAILREYPREKFDLAEFTAKGADRNRGKRNPSLMPKLPWKSAKRAVNEYLHGIGTRYHSQIPMKDMMDYMEMHGIIPLDEDGEPLTGVILTGRSGKAVFPVTHEGKPVNSMWVLTWHKFDETGRYEIVSYLS